MPASEHFKIDDQWCELGLSCKMRSAHGKLREAHRLWHLALDHYDEVDSFTTYLNGAIQALRNVTFALQKDKSEVPGFEEWYPKWQEALRNDEVSKWLVQARNVVVKRGDLEKLSIARVSLVISYWEEPAADFETDPMLQIEQIVGSIGMFTSLPDEVTRDGFLRVERRWVSTDLQDHELLDALAHCHGILRVLLMDCHIVSDFGVSNQFKSTKLYRQLGMDKVFQADARLSCMIAAADERTVSFRLNTGKGVKYELEQRPLNPAAQKEGSARFEEFKRKTGFAAGDKTLESTVNDFVEMAIFNLESDGYLAPYVFLLTRDDEMLPMLVEPEDQADKYQKWRGVANVVQQSHVVQLVALSEVWVAQFDPSNPLRHAANAEDRKEAVLVYGMNNSGEEYSVTWLFERIDGRIEMRERTKEHVPDASFLEPVRQVWGTSSR